MKKCIVFEITAKGKPRMVHSDRWANRKVVNEYWAFKDEINLMARRKNYRIGVILDVIFYLPMPDSWSEKKKQAMIGKPHQQKPDLDNLCKSFTDSLTDEDKDIYDCHIRKYWDKSGRIEVFI